ncbi:adhesin [Escherichia coli]|nr:adhesin [Escherichia coli]HDQ6586671.1 adhesin [Escherichia coli O187:H28]EFH0337862.1 adhesin [Escherichia coli]EHS3287396.1 adhesin [Escherichia coli]EHS3292725.1 adhesin [Escherichia coli]
MKLSKKRVLTALSSTVLIVASSLSQAVELNLVPRNGVIGDLYDGTNIATGRIVCLGEHMSFNLWINSPSVENNPGHYIIQGRQDSRHKLYVRIDGEGWSPSVREGRKGMVRYGQDEQAVFHVVLDGRQNVVADEYVYSITGECL